MSDPVKTYIQVLNESMLFLLGSAISELLSLHRKYFFGMHIRNKKSEKLNNAKKKHKPSLSLDFILPCFS